MIGGIEWEERCETSRSEWNRITRPIILGWRERSILPHRKLQKVVAFVRKSRVNSQFSKIEGNRNSEFAFRHLEYQTK